ncbi:hypothetical protein HYN59_16240 [Flavobacterium album]|uniref:T9SS C-terminal target domain-containing protein n=1 Tax=Flavobacterium album TaxID=2175091 RepID=A0A2S1R1L0_9FLAO|nr:hypothetical protein [Flavobacterium album]AWH86560.1 hypothetical protein HYN59_16240 [Flavobacterium album]
MIDKYKHFSAVKLLPLFYLFCAAPVSGLYAQVQNNASLYIGEGANMHVSQGTYNFGTGAASTVTSRSTNYGVLSFAAAVSSANASNSHFINGYFRYYGTDAVIAPVGSNAVLAPVRLVPATTSGVDVAYVRNVPTEVGTSVSSYVNQISAIEYWKLSGASAAVITLTWRASSNISSMLTTSLSDLTIVGYNGSEWVEIPSTFDTVALDGSASTPTAGSITSTSAVSPGTYSAVTLGVKIDTSCFPILASSGNIKTWNGSSWSPSAPQANDPVVINAPFSGSLTCHSITMNANYTLADGDVLDVVRGFTGNGTVIMSPEASLLQRDGSAAPPKIQISKITNPMRRFDYVFLSSPINDFATFFGHISSASNAAVNGSYDTYPNSAFYNFFTDNNGTNSIPVTASNVPIGRGLAATVRYTQGPYNTSTAAGAWYTEKYPVHIKTEGTANNGPIIVPVPDAAGWVRIGNPYPSPLNAVKLLDAMGGNFRKTIYFWTYNTPRQGLQNSATNYNDADYAVYNYSGGVAACQGCQVPSGYIATMQSVYVRKINPSPITFSLTNCIRNLSGNDNFFRNNEAQTGKFWLNLNGSSGSFSQVLIAYSSAGTTAYDNGYDSTRLGNVSTSEFNSLIEGSTTGYAIQTRPLFEPTDIVPLQVVKRAEETFSVTYNDGDGVFATDDVTIYLHDKLLGLYHNLKENGPYTFAQAENVNTDRFEVVYNAEVLSGNEFTAYGAFAYAKDHTFYAHAGLEMKQVEIFDLTGRLVQVYKDINDMKLSRPFNHEQAVYLAKITLINGAVVKQKVINY